MFYREAGDFKTNYADDNQTFPIRFDRYRYYAVMLFAFCAVPFLINDYWVNAIFLPFLIIDLVVSSILMSMGMMMLPPVTISLPFKLIFFVLVDGWRLISGSLVESFISGPPG